MRSHDRAGTGTVGLLICATVDRRLLSEFLSEIGCAVITADAHAGPDALAAADLLIADESSAQRHAAALQAMKRAADPLLLPILVLLSRSSAGAPWIRSGFDDVLRQPLAKVEMGARVEAFLRLRRQSQNALRDSEARFRETFDQAPSGIAHSAPDGRYLMVNRRLCELLGYSEAELLALSFPSLIHADDLDATLNARESMLAGRSRTYRDEKRYVHKDGRVVWAEVTVSLVRGTDGKPKYFISVINDISERKRLEDNVRRTARARKVMAQCNHVLVHAVEERALLQEMCESAVATGEYRAAWIGIPANDEQQTIEVAACAGLDLRALRETGVNLRPDSEQSRGPMATALRTQAPVVENDLLASPHLGYWHHRAEANGIRAALALPLIAGEACLGGLLIFAAEVDAFTGDEIELLSELAADIAYGITALRTRAAHQLAAAALRESERFARATIDTLNQQICVIDGSGFITATNRAWDEFAAGNGAPAPACVGLGANYLDVCDQAAADGCQQGRAVAGALRAIMRGERSLFSLEYECSGPAQEGWYVLTAKRFEGEGPVRVVISHDNITARKLMEDRLRDSEARFRSLTELSSDWYWEQDEHYRFRGISGRTLERVWPYGPAAIGKTRWEIGAEDPAQYVNLTAADWAAHRALLDAHRPFRDFYIEHRLLDGSVSYVSISGEPVFDSDGRFKGYRGTGKDMTHLKSAERALLVAREHLRFLLAATPAVIFSCAPTPPHAPTFFSENAREQFGFEPSELLENPALWLECVHPDDAARVAASLPRVLETGRHAHDYRLRRKDGTYVWVQEETRLVEGRDGVGREIVGYLIDVDDKKRAEEKLLHLAHYDDLTKLPNRVLFRDRLIQSIAQARRNDWIIGLMFLDVDRFKLINDTLGHAAGDALLRMVSARIAATVRSGDTVARLGGDEFGVILTDMARAEDASLVADKILRAFDAPFLLDEREVFVSPSIGVTLYPPDGAEPDELIKKADSAMYRAKELGRNNWQLYTDEMNVRSLERLDMENSLRHALERREFVLYYQPRVDVRSGCMTGMEALLRWRRADGTMVSPGEFVPLLEETGLIIPVGDWVLREACRQQQQWRRAGLPAVPIAVNLSARQLYDASMVERVREIAGEGSGCAGLIELEITESTLMRNPEQVVAMLSEMRALGVRIAIDDFGTGYSSLSYLKRFPLDCLKIDQSFVRDITTDQNDGAIVRTIISIARQMDLKVVAEGVETSEQLAFLKALDCEEAQGYLFARPMDAAAIGEYLRRRDEPLLAVPARPAA